MAAQIDRDRLITDTNVRAFFHESLTAALKNQNRTAEDHTIAYVTNLLAGYTRTDMLYDQTPDGPMLRPLALLYADAVQAGSEEERQGALRRLGDVALFVSGVFPDSLARTLVDVDYYIAMGGSAYAYLVSNASDSPRARAWVDAFEELANRFYEFVELLGEVADLTNLRSETDVMRLYDAWMRTGSPRAARQLRSLGIHVVDGAERRRRAH